MKISFTIEDTILDGGIEGLALQIVPLNPEEAEEAAKHEPTKAMWVASTIVHLFNTGSLIPIVQQYMAASGAANGAEGPVTETTESVTE